MSTKQKAKARHPVDRHRRYYFRLFADYCDRLDLPNTRETRHAANREALGYAKSSTLWTETEWDIVLEFLRHRISGGSGEWSQAHRVAVEVDGERRRKLHRIQREIPEAYLREIAWDKFRRTDYRLMTLPDLEQLRITAIERRRSAEKKGKDLHAAT